MQAHLQLRGSGVVPRFEMECRLAEMNLHEATPTNAVEPLKGRRELGLQLLAQPAEEVCRREHCPGCQPAEHTGSEQASHG